MFTRGIVLLTWFQVYLVKGSYLYILHGVCNFSPSPVAQKSSIVSRFAYILFSSWSSPNYVEWKNQLSYLFDSLCSYWFTFLNLLVVCVTGILRTLFSCLLYPPSVFCLLSCTADVSKPLQSLVHNGIIFKQYFIACLAVIKMTLWKCRAIVGEGTDLLSSCWTRSL